MNKGFVNNCRDLDEGCLFCPVRGKFESCSKDEMLAHIPARLTLSLFLAQLGPYASQRRLVYARNAGSVVGGQGGL